MTRQVKCPTCGNAWPVATDDHDARRLAHRAAMLKNVERRAQRDAGDVWPGVPELFLGRHVAERMAPAGRHWSEHQGVIGRAERLGWIERLARVMIGRRECQLWRKTKRLQQAIKLHNLALKVKRTNEKGLTRKRR